MPRFTVTVSGTTCAKVEFGGPTPLGEALRAAGAPVSLPCSGAGRCGKCVVKAAGALTPPTEAELRALGPARLEAGFRLACQAAAIGDCAVEYTAASGHAIISEGFMARRNIDAGRSGLGAAVDIGTTTLVCYLYDLSSGELLAAKSALNPQRSFGADVISRIEASLNGEAGELAAAVRAGAAGLMEQCCADIGAKASAINDIVVAANTAMLYLLAARSPKSIAAAPFEADDLFGRSVAATELELPAAPGARVFLMRAIGAYVGGDITAAMLSSDLLGRGGAAALLMDIGTNGEIVLAANGGANSCSTAAGPAFEGAGISFGMQATAGAISRVWRAGGEMRYETIGGAPAAGICGTGIIDAVAALLRAGVVDETGRMRARGHAFESAMTEIDGAPAFVFLGGEVAVTQKDIRAVQLAKSAICAGAETLLARAGIAAADIGGLYIAGGLGSYIDADNAEFIGLIPAGLAKKAVVLGNAAGAGASMALLSSAERAQSGEIAKATGNFELSADAVFSQKYMDGMLFSC